MQIFEIVVFFKTNDPKDFKTNDPKEKSMAHPNRCGLSAAIIVAATLALGHGGRAEGIVVFADVKGIGQSLGYAVGYSSAAQARSIAFSDCRKGPDKQVTARCAVFATFRGACFAYASVREGLRGYGLAIAANVAQAQSQALAKCRAMATAEESEPQTCRVRMSDCDK